jgi:hypothetical protein
VHCAILAKRLKEKGYRKKARDTRFSIAGVSRTIAQDGKKNTLILLTSNGKKMQTTSVDGKKKRLPPNGRLSRIFLLMPPGV